MPLGLSNRPCATCGTDTLHRVITCTVCNTIATVPSVSRDAKVKARMKRLSFGQRRIEMAKANKLRNQYDREHGNFMNARTDKAPGGVRGAFGRGRHRTVC